MISVLCHGMTLNQSIYPITGSLTGLLHAGFYPTFLFVDSVTGVRGVFTGQYTLRAIAGGSSENNMRPFSLTDIV